MDQVLHGSGRDDKKRETIAKPATPPSRELAGSDHESWRVFERLLPREEWTTADEDTERAGFSVGWLYFESTSGERRRLRLYPKHWIELSDATLRHLCSRALSEPTGNPG